MPLTVFVYCTLVLLVWGFLLYEVWFLFWHHAAYGRLRTALNIEFAFCNTPENIFGYLRPYAQAFVYCICDIAHS